MTQTDTDVDLTDLDGLDGMSHAYCRLCLPGGPRLVVPGERFPALCGVEAFSWTGDRCDASSPPPDACPRCIELLPEPCPRCGNVWDPGAGL